MSVNAYMMIDDGDHYVVCAPSMHEAIAYAENVYISENYPDDEDDNTPEKMAEERQYYRDTMLQSCQLLGPVK